MICADSLENFPNREGEMDKFHSRCSVPKQALSGGGGALHCVSDHLVDERCTGPDQQRTLLIHHFGREMQVEQSYDDYATKFQVSGDIPHHGATPHH